jgi:hypothetical protein
MAQTMPSDKDFTLVDKDHSELLQDNGMYVFMDDVGGKSCGQEKEKRTTVDDL